MLRIRGRTIGFRINQLEFLKLNPDFEIAKFCRDKLDIYMEERDEILN